MIQWIIGCIAIIFILMTAKLLLRTVNNFIGELKHSMIIFPVGCIIGAIPPVILCFYGIFGKQIDYAFWVVSIVVYILLSVYLVFSMRKLENLLIKLQKMK